MLLILRVVRAAHAVTEQGVKKFASPGTAMGCGFAIFCKKTLQFEKSKTRHFWRVLVVLTLGIGYLVD
ncbi:hypothetical protein FY034_11500 [Trichlorobacter lovleyi]|uniref:hypothetical protein n=1 Tax=Trichlorobacter lovleyi TaxID=313985 RepID=UPI002240DCBC|nr:hypothetical protein [Trichlorobacter lovleyi]QOX79536.1 hypothetical protein FY034_11500 [Trichlorobacter lovleyi]